MRTTLGDLRQCLLEDVGESERQRRQDSGEIERIHRRCDGKGAADELPSRLAIALAAEPSQEPQEQHKHGTGQHAAREKGQKPDGSGEHRYHEDRVGIEGEEQ